MSEGGALTTVFVDHDVAKLQLKKSKLVIVEGPDKGHEQVMDQQRFSVGRSSVADLTLADKAVSGIHLELVAGQDGVLLRDIDSTNGTFVGEMRVREVWLRPGTVVRAGQTKFRFEALAGHVDIDLSKKQRFFDLVGKSVKMREIFATLEKVANTDLTVLVRGETGTGKELVARAIHQASRRAQGPMVVQDCSSIPRDLIESTLFGHEKGAFTGAHDRQRGCFEQADGGTIFLDEIGELDLGLQPKLLRVLENREVKRVGGAATLPVDVRVVSATNRDPRRMVNDGTFREDLYYRLGIVTIELPPLRDRPEDIPLLVESFLHDVAQQAFPGQDKRFEIQPDAMARLLTQPWPGNVRELRNVIVRAASLADGDILTQRDLFPGAAPVHTPTTQVGVGSGNAAGFVEEGLPFKEAKQRVLDGFEAAYLEALLEKHGGNITRSAQAAGLTRYHLRELAKRYGVHGTGKD